MGALINDIDPISKVFKNIKHLLEADGLKLKQFWGIKTLLYTIGIIIGSNLDRNRMSVNPAAGFYVISMSCRGNIWWAVTYCFAFVCTGHLNVTKFPGLFFSSSSRALLDDVQYIRFRSGCTCSNTSGQTPRYINIKNKEREREIY